jgi:phage repressor protein C with HTH and peptisase S24 domain
MSTAPLVCFSNSAGNDLGMATENRKAKVTPENLEEAKRLKALWDKARAAGGPTQTVFGETYDIGTQSAVNLFLTGTTPLSLKAARGFAKGLGCEIADFSTRLAAEARKNAEFASAGDDSEDFADIKRVDVQVSAGHGAEPVVEETIGSLKFKNSFLRSLGVSVASARIVNVAGDSMDPTIKDGAVILVSTKNRDPINNAIFALARPGPDPLIVKRLLLIDGQWIARSDNRDFADIKIGDGEPVTIIGRAMWMGARL